LKGRTNITTNALEGLKIVDIIERIYQAANIPTKSVKSGVLESKTN
jgi:hypothetical protein